MAQAKTTATDKQRRGPATRVKLLSAAAELFNDVGYFGTDSNCIARAAGYAPGTFYRHFTDKREIFLATYEQWVEVEWIEIREQLARSRGNPIRRISRLVLDHHRRWSVFRQSLIALAATDPVVKRFRVAQRKTQLSFMAELLRKERGTTPSPARCLLALLSFERVCDAIADGEVSSLRISEASLLRSLQQQLGNLEQPE